MPKYPWCNMDFISDPRALEAVIHWSPRRSPSWENMSNTDAIDAE